MAENSSSSSKKTNYYDQRNLSNLLKIREILTELPDWFAGYIRASETTHSSLTRLNYCYDIRIFLTYLQNENRLFAGLPFKSMTADLIDQLTLNDLELYVEYLGYFVSENDEEHENSERGKARKIASLRSTFSYLYKKQMIHSNPASLLDMPKIHEKAIIQLSSDEIGRMLESIENGDGLTEKQLQYHNKTIRRDYAICVLFLTTGIRVSELVGLNISDFNFEEYSFRVTRKGGNQVILYFDVETEQALQDYLDERRAQMTYSLSSPLFLSLQGNRMSVKSVENLVKKYAKIAAPLKKITPHKLRSTYGTMLYDKTEDIYLVADVLGHKDVNTTKKYYASMSDEHRRRAAGQIRLNNQTDSSKDD